jgi:hypothetical protein
MGAANPIAAMNKSIEVAIELGLKGLKIAAVTGDDVMDKITDVEVPLLETGENLKTLTNKVISANAYLGASPIIEALKNNADVIITGRVADPALFIAPIIHEFGWSMTDYHLLGKATVLGHLLECAGQVTGGYFADPGFKDVPDPGTLGFPIAETDNEGNFSITKVPGSGGKVTTATCKEQLLYEIHDPCQYYTPDVVADFSKVSMLQTDSDQVQITGGTGYEKNGKYKVSIGYRDSFIGEGQISYGGPGAADRAKLAIDIVKKRLALTNLNYSEIRYDVIGMNSLYGDKISSGEPFEARIRVVARTTTLKDAVKVGNEVETLYTNGPAGGGGATKSTREVIAIQSIFINSDKIKPVIHYKTI